jgi:3-oxoacyl-[acyl-carrier protein] reductase
MDLGLAGKVALVTGSNRGIGRGIAVALADEGCDLILTGRDEAALRGVVDEVETRGRKATAQALDLREPSAAAALIDTVRRGPGRLDILVNNAGAAKRGDFLELTDDDWQDGFALKFFAHVRLARAAWPMLKASGGSLVTIAGTGARKPGADFTIGSSVNSACVAFSKALADRGKVDGVQVNSVNPGHTDTDRFRRRIDAHIKQSGHDEATVLEEHRRELGLTRFGLPEDIAGLVAFIVSPRGRWLHGATIDMDGGEIPVL